MHEGHHRRDQRDHCGCGKDAVSQMASLATRDDAVHRHDMQEVDALGAMLQRIVKMHVIAVGVPCLRIAAQFPLQVFHRLAFEAAVEEILHPHFQFATVHKRVWLTAS